jgi:hypothetical protein
MQALVEEALQGVGKCRLMKRGGLLAGGILERQLPDDFLGPLDPIEVGADRNEAGLAAASLK